MHPTQALFPERQAVDRPGLALHDCYVAKVIAVNPAAGTVQCELQQDGSHMPDCRVLQLRAGPSSGFIWLPQVEDLVLIAFAQGHKALPVVVGSLYDDHDGLPSAAADALLLKHQSGASIAIDAAGKITLDAKGSTITLAPDGKITLTPGAGTVIELGGTVPVARHGDSTTPGPGGHTHTIIASSTMVEAG